MTILSHISHVTDVRALPSTLLWKWSTFLFVIHWVSRRKVLSSCGRGRRRQKVSMNTCKLLMAGALVFFPFPNPVSFHPLVWKGQGGCLPQLLLLARTLNHLALKTFSFTVAGRIHTRERHRVLEESSPLRVFWSSHFSLESAVLRSRNDWGDHSQYAAKFKGYTSQIQLNVCFCFPSHESFVDFGIVGSL